MLKTADGVSLAAWEAAPEKDWKYAYVPSQQAAEPTTVSF
jgi:hypothetical protein